MVKLDFIVSKALAAPVIYGCDYCDQFVEAIWPRLKHVELEDGTVVPTVLRPLKRATKWQVPLRTAEEAPLPTRDSIKL